MLHYPQDYDVLWTGYDELLPPRDERSIREQFNRVYGMDRYECRDGRGDAKAAKQVQLMTMKPGRSHATHSTQ